MPTGSIELLKELLTEYFKPLYKYTAIAAASPGPLWLYREKHLLAIDFAFRLSQIQIPDKVSDPEYILAKHLKTKFDLEKNEKPLEYSMSSEPLSEDELSQLVNLAMNEKAGDHAKHATSLLITLLLRDAYSILNRNCGLALLHGNTLTNPKFILNRKAIIPIAKPFFGSLLYTLMDDKVDPTTGNLGKVFVDLSHCHFHSEIGMHFEIRKFSFKGQDLSHSQFSWLELNNCNFAFCNLSNTIFEECKGADLFMHSASMHHAKFLNCTFSKPNLQWATLRDSIFKNTQLGTDANNKADLKNCDLNNSQFDQDCSLRDIVENSGTQWVNARLPDDIRSSPPPIAVSTSAAEHADEIKYRALKKKLFAHSTEHADSLPDYWTSAGKQLVKPLRKKISGDELLWFIKKLFDSTSDSLYYQSRFEGIRLERARRQGRLFSQLTSEILTPLTHIGLLGCTEILDIEQYENKEWWSLYQKKKAELKKKFQNPLTAPLENVAWHSPEFSPLLDATIGECMLFHGNSNPIIEEILQHGNKRTTDEPEWLRGWGALGKGGPYLSDAIPKAMQYTKCPDCDREQCGCPGRDLSKPRKLLANFVLLGEIEQTKNDKEHRFNAHQNVDFDSVLGPTNMEIPDSHFDCNEFLPLEPAGNEPFFLHPSVYPAFILTVRQHPKQLSRDHALRLKEKYHSRIPIAENFQKEFTKHEKSIKEFRFTQNPLNKILECIETYYRLLNHQTLPKDKCLYALSILSENCKIALDYYKNIKDLSCLLEELDKNIANEYEHLDGSSRSRNTPSTTAQLIENIRHETVGHHYLCSALRTMKTDLSIAKANADDNDNANAKSIAREAIMAFSSILSTQPFQIPTPAITQIRLESALAHTLLDQPHQAIEDILFIHQSNPTDEDIKSYWHYCINLSPKLTLELIIHILGQQPEPEQKVDEAYYFALSQAISRAFGENNAFKWGDAAVIFILSCYKKLTRAEKANCIEALTEHPHLKPDDKALLPLIARLRHAQEPDGWYYQLEVEENNWRQKLKQSFFIEQAPKSSNRKIKIFKEKYEKDGANSSYCFATPEIEAQILTLFNEDGILQKKDPTKPGNHITLRVEDKFKHVFWLKIAPEQPATEFSVNLLDRLATGHAQTPMTSMMLIQHVKNPAQTIAVQISSEAPGDVLSQTVNKQEVISYPKNLAKLSLSSFLRHLLRVLLINPEDDKGDDYFLYQTKDGYELFRIDNERAFYKPIIGDPRDILQLRLTSTQVLQVKSILYCLEQMNARLDQDVEARSVLKQFCELDCHSALKTWLNELEQWHQEYAPLFRDVLESHYNGIAGNSRSVLALTNPTESEFIQLASRFESLQEIISLKLKENSSITGRDLLAVLNQDLVNRELTNIYRKAFNENPVGAILPQEQAARVTARFDQVTKELYEFNSKTGRRYSTAPPKDISLDKVKDNSENKESPIVSEARQVLQRLKEKKLSKIVEWILEAPKDKMKVYNLQKDKKELYNHQNDSTKRVLVRRIFTAIKSDKNHTIDVNTKKFILEMVLGSPIYDLPLNLFSDCNIDEAFIKNLFRENGEYILKLNLDDCQFITPKMLSVISLTCININTLSCKRSNITSLRGTFPTLEKLEIDDSLSITEIDIKAQNLKELSAANCQNVNRVQTGSYQLETVNFINCLELTGKSIAKLTLFPGYLRAITLEGTKISASHRALAEAYPYLVMLPLENVSEKFVEKIKTEMDKTVVNINFATAQKIFDGLLVHGQECQRIFSYVEDNLKNLVGGVWLKAVDFLGKKEVVDYYIDNRYIPDKIKISTSLSISDKIFTSLLPLLSNAYPGSTNSSAARVLGQIAVYSIFTTAELQTVIHRLCDLLMSSNHDDVRKSAANALVQISVDPRISPLPMIDCLWKLLSASRHDDLRTFVAKERVRIGANPNLSQSPYLGDCLWELLRQPDFALTVNTLCQIGANPSVTQYYQFETMIAFLCELIFNIYFEVIFFRHYFLNESDLNVQISAISTLGQIGVNPIRGGDSRCVVFLHNLVKKSDFNVEISAVSTLGQIGVNPSLGQSQFERVVAFLHILLNGSDVSVQISAVSALAQIGGNPSLGQSQFETVVACFYDLLKASREPTLFSYVASALGQIGANRRLTPPPQLQKIMALLYELQKDPEWLIQSSAAIALDQIDPNHTLAQLSEVTDRLCELLENSPPIFTQCSIASTLGQIGVNPRLAQPQFEKIIAHLYRLLNKPDDRQTIIAKAMYGDDVQNSAANALGQIGANPKLAQARHEAVIESLYYSLHSTGRKDVQRCLARSLGHIGANRTLTPVQVEKVIDLLCELLEIPERIVRCAAVSALAEIGAHHPLTELQFKMMIPTMANMLKDLGSSVAEALCHIAANPTLTQAQLQVLHDIVYAWLKNSNSDIQSSAADALTLIARKQKLTKSKIDAILPLSPRILSALYSEEYIHNVINDSLHHSDAIPKAIMNAEKSAATSTKISSTSGHSPRLFSDRKQPASALTNATITLVSTQSASSTSSSSSSSTSEDIATRSNAF